MLFLKGKASSREVHYKIKSQNMYKDSSAIEKESGKKYLAINNITLYTDCETSKGFFKEKRSFSKDAFISENIKGIL